MKTSAILRARLWAQKEENEKKIVRTLMTMTILLVFDVILLLVG